VASGSFLMGEITQVGSDVPAERLELSPVDQMFVRMGARDQIMAGQSTFLVELLETASMLVGVNPSFLNDHIISKECLHSFGF